VAPQGKPGGAGRRGPGEASSSQVIGLLPMPPPEGPPARPPAEASTGAEALLRTAAAAGVDVCFANPGTSEMALVAALDRVPEIRAVLGLFEGVCTGAADGYGRMAGRPALTLLHHGPGFANGIANLHNAWRARSTVVNLIGDHPDRHLPHDPPLASDVASLSRPVSAWLRRSSHAERLGADVAEAIAAASRPPGAVATLVTPSDTLAGAASGPAEPLPAPPAPGVEAERVEGVGALLRRGGAPVLLLGGPGLGERGLRAAGRIADTTGCRLVFETWPSRVERGGDLPRPERLPYFAEQVVELLKAAPGLVLAGARAPVAFFAHPGLPGRLVPESCETRTLATPREDVAAALENLADALDAPRRAALRPGAGQNGTGERPHRPEGPLDPQSLGAAVAAVQPEGAIVVEEAATSGGPWLHLSAAGPRHTVLMLTGGAIGQGLPAATGAALACPERPVLALQADGSGLYTLQALWTQAREGLDVTTVVCANRSYRILQIELLRAGVAEPGPQAGTLTSLDRPAPDWAALARGFGVPGERVERAEDLVRALERAFAEPGPHLIEAVL